MSNKLWLASVVLLMVVRCFLYADSCKEDKDLLKAFSRVFCKECIYVVDDEYVLQAIYDQESALEHISVVPKYFFEETHPEWKEPYNQVVMIQEGYKLLLQRISVVKPLGKLLEQGSLGVSINLRSVFQDLYEKGVVERAMFRYSPDKVYDVAYFHVYYFHNVKGKIESKEKPGERVPDHLYRVKIDAVWYWTSEKSFHGAILGQEVTIQAAGPIRY